MNAPRAAIGVTGVVGHEDVRHTPRLMQVEEEVHDHGSVDAVEVPGRFVGEDQGWFVDDATRDGDALALAAGELVGQVP